MLMNQTENRVTPEPTPTTSHGVVQRWSDFDNFAEALDYAAKGDAGVNFYDAYGVLEQSLTYTEIRIRAREIADCLLGAGLKRKDSVGIVAEMSADFICTLFACQYAGILAVPLPVITGLGGRQGYEKHLRTILEISQARAAIGSEKLAEDLKRAGAGLDLAFIGTLKEFEQDFPGKGTELVPFGADDPSHIQYSSGSTRNPKGIVISQRSLMANAKSVAQHGLKFRENDRVASWLPFYHDMGLIGFLMIPATSQLSIDYMNTDSFARRPLLWLELIARNRVTMAFSPSFGYEICMRRAARKEALDLDLSCWRAAGIGGEMVQPEVMAEFSKTFASYGFKPEAFVPSYGLAEITLAFSFSPLETGVVVDRVNKADIAEKHHATPADEHTEEVRSFASCGYPMPDYDVEIRDEQGATLSDRAIGAVFIKGPALMDGYFRDEEATKSIIVEDGWMNTGDMGYMTQGALVITGRQKDLIIINGRNIWPQDIEWHVEHTIESLRNRDTSAFAVSDNDGKEQAVILVHTRVQGDEERAQLRQAVKAAIFQNTGVDCKVVLIPPSSLPFTTSGKLSRTKAKNNYLAGILQDVESNEKAA